MVEKNAHDMNNVFFTLGHEAIVVLPGTVQTVVTSELSTSGNLYETQYGDVHESERPGEPDLNCNQCGVCFGKKEELDHHKTTHTGERIFQCNQFGKRFSDKWHLNERERTHTQEKPFQCNQCGKSFSLKGNLNQHILTHTGEKAFKCNFCFKCFSHKGHLNEHRRIHTGEKPFSCNQCDKRFNRKGLLKQHLKTHTREKLEVTDSLPGTVQTVVSCEQSTSGDVCEGEAGIADKEERAGEPLFECNQCKKCFTQEEDLDQHKRSHTEEKPFECNQCGKRFSLKGNLNQHKITHTGKKAFKCNYCNRCFGHKGHLNEHTRIHTGEKPFSCSQCDKRFNRKGLLKQHLKTHTGGKRLKCVKCGEFLCERGSVASLEEESLNENQCPRCFRQTQGNLTGEGTLNERLRNQLFRETENPQQHKPVEKGDPTLIRNQGEKFEIQGEFLEDVKIGASLTEEPFNGEERGAFATVVELFR